MRCKGNFLGRTKQVQLVRCIYNQENKNERHNKGDRINRKNSGFKLMAERVTRIMIHDSYLIKDSKDKYNIFIIYTL